MDSSGSLNSNETQKQYENCPHCRCLFHFSSNKKLPDGIEYENSSTWRRNRRRRRRRRSSTGPKRLFNPFSSIASQEMWHWPKKNVKLTRIKRFQSPIAIFFSPLLLSRYQTRLVDRILNIPKEKKNRKRKRQSVEIPRKANLTPIQFKLNR